LGRKNWADDRVVLASRILEEIRAGEPVEYDGFTIAGDIEIDNLDDLPSARKLAEHTCYSTNCSSSFWPLAIPV
jgi:hypothetical protein